MQKTKGGGMLAGSAGRNERHRAVVTDLASVIDRVRRSLVLIESEIAGEAHAEEAADIIVLDDVTPGYSRAQAALQDCEAGLRAALHLLQESVPPADRTCEFVAGESRRPAH